LQALDGQVIDEEDLRQALGQFDPVWDHLISDEKSRVLQLLIEEVTYNGQTGDVKITFRPGGVRALAVEEKATA
jgi:hypothetical protein